MPNLNPNAKEVFNHISTQGKTLSANQLFNMKMSQHRSDTLTSVIYQSQVNVKQSLSSEPLLVPVITERQLQNWRINTSDHAYFVNIPPTSSQTRHSWSGMDPDEAEQEFADRHDVIYRQMSKQRHLLENPYKCCWWERERDEHPVSHHQLSIAVTPSAVGFRAAPLTTRYAVVGNIALITPYEKWLLTLLNSQLFQFMQLMMSTQQFNLEALYNIPVANPTGQVKADLEKCEQQRTKPDILHNDYHLQRTDTEYAVFELYQITVPQRRTLIETLMYHRDRLGLQTPTNWYTNTEVAASAGAWRYARTEKHA